VVTQNRIMAWLFLEHTFGFRKVDTPTEILPLLCALIVSVRFVLYRPWVIRTDPKERGFEYLSGVKRQAGQDRNLVEASLGAEGTAVATESVTNLGRSLDNLEAAAVAGKTRKGEKPPLTDVEELEALRKLNESASSEGKDVDFNASIRKSFRTYRRENRRRLMGAGSMGWRKGMSLLPSSESDVLASKETCYGRASVNERSKLSRVRKSSIFDSSSHHLKQAKRKGKHKRENSSRSNAPEVVASSDPDLVASSNPNLVASGRPLEDLPSPTSTPDNFSSSPCSLPTAIPKMTLKLFNNNGAVSIASNKTTSASGTTKTGCSSSKGQETPKESNRKADAPLSFLELVGVYGSSDEDVDD